MDEPFYIKEAKGDLLPIIISIPHSGTEFPKEIEDDYLPEQREYLDDTDWFLHDLNDYAPHMGISVIHAKYSRWAIDLNRDPDSAPLYNDGRIITGLCTTTDFLGNPIYKEGCEPDQNEIKRRLEKYYWPYYNKIQSLLKAHQEQFGKALLWDSHSIREKVPTIRSTPFPQMILGDNEERSADKSLIDLTLSHLSQHYQVNHNDPFKGGHITRYFGDPENNIHALQLERNKNLYMDDAERLLHPERAEQMREVLKPLFEKLAQALLS